MSKSLKRGKGLKYDFLKLTFVQKLINLVAMNKHIITSITAIMKDVLTSCELTFRM